jgi:K(+)-stimulated pyrophosphate-energized sodium pump
VPACGIVGLAYAFIAATWVGRQDAGSDRMKAIGAKIGEGAMAFLKSEYRVLAVFVLVIGALLAATADVQSSSRLIGLSFVVGALCSGLAGFFGMRVATGANIRTAAAARTGLPGALAVAFRGGTVMGMSVVGLALLGLGGLFVAYSGTFGALHNIEGASGGIELTRVINVLAGFSMGASSIALFARVGGGIYTKAADVGADLVGKVEAGIPEDHRLNPATIADNVGDNVGDVAGMGADLFESYVGSIIGAMILGAAASSGRLEAVMIPLAIAGAGIVVSLVATFFVRTKEGGNPQLALDIGAFGAAVVLLPVSYFIIDFFLGRADAAGHPIVLDGDPATTMSLMIALVGGLGAGVVIGLLTGYYCSKYKAPVESIVHQSMTGPATNLIAGIAVGFKSTALPILMIAVAIFVANHFAGVYGVALAAVGMLSTTGIQLAVDAYGPIADNAGGVAEMSGLPGEVRDRTDNLDAVGNTTAAIGKGFAIGSAALAALSLFAAYRKLAFGPNEEIVLTDPQVLIGLLVGAMLPFLFSSMAMRAVGDAAGEMIEEVRRQFREIPALRPALDLVTRADAEKRELTAEEEQQIDKAAMQTQVERCVAISTNASLKRMVAPGFLALIAPVVMGAWSAAALGGLLAGTLASGVMLALFMANAGGAWDNAKKQIEEQDKNYDPEVNTGKGSDRHKAAVIGDTVGDPFKDTAGPSLNILIKLMTIVAVVIAPLVAN